MGDADRSKQVRVDAREAPEGRPRGRCQWLSRLSAIGVVVNVDVYEQAVGRRTGAYCLRGPDRRKAPKGDHKRSCLIMIFPKFIISRGHRDGHL